MDNTDYITIAEAAAKANISKQAVYQRLNKDLNKYVKVIDGKKQLHIDCLSVLLKQVEQEVEQVDSSSLNNVIDTLRSQLEVKDQQIAEKDKQIAELQSLLSKTQDNLSHAIAVQAGMIQTQLQAPMPAPPPEPASNPEQEQPLSSAEEEQDQKKRNWWQRLWD